MDVSRVMRPLRVPIGALLILAAFVAILLIFQRGEEHRDAEPDSVRVVNAIVALQEEYFDPMDTAIKQADPDCRTAPLSSAPLSCGGLVDVANRLDPLLLEAAAPIEAFEEERRSSGDEALIQGLQQSVARAKLAHEFNVLLATAWQHGDGGKWEAAWATWDRLTTEISPTRSP